MNIQKYLQQYVGFNNYNILLILYINIYDYMKNL